MAGFGTDKDRKVVPRWRTLDITLRHGELNSTAPPRAQKVTSDFLAQKLMDWRRHQTVGHAADLVGAALTLGREREVTGAARFLLQNDLRVSSWARELAEQALKTPANVETVPPKPEALEKGAFYARVRDFRRLLRAEPRDPITWVELSRTYAILGLGEQAARSMTVALQLAVNNRFVLRSASRLWIHLEDPEKAHDIIVRSDRTTHDPWLLAAEIAVGSVAGRKPKFIKAARRMLTDRRFSPIHISELASAVATLELGSGSVKKPRQLFNLSLKRPTENSIAQAAWASRQNSSIRLNDKYLDLPNTFEARSWSFYLQSQWKQSIKECQLWQFDQPFSSRPSVQGSYVSAVALEDYRTSAWFARRGLMANPEDFTLLNNLAFACINRGDIKSAEEALARVDRLLQLSDREQAVLQATRGFLKFRTGNVAIGRQLYLDARSKARKIQAHDGGRLLALASVFHAIEEVSQEVSDSRPMVSETFQALKRVSDPIFRVLEHKLTKITTRPRGGLR